MCSPFVFLCFFFMGSSFAPRNHDPLTPRKKVVQTAGRPWLVKVWSEIKQKRAWLYCLAYHINSVSTDVLGWIVIRLLYNCALLFCFTSKVQCRIVLVGGLIVIVAVMRSRLSRVSLVHVLLEGRLAKQRRECSSVYNGSVGVLPGCYRGS